MKKTFLFLLLTTFVATSWAQSLSKVQGKTKDNKTLKVTYYHGASEDYIETVSYQLVDELQAKANKLQNEVKQLQNKLDAANKNKSLNESSNKSAAEQVKQLDEQVKQKEQQIQDLNNQIARLQTQLDSVSMKATSDKQKLENDIIKKDQQIAELQEKPTSSSVIGAEANFGHIVPINCIRQEWTGNNKVSMQFNLYYGSPSLIETFPLSIEGGLGIHMFSLSAQQSAHTNKTWYCDNEGDSVQAIYNYSDLKEELALTYLDIPIRICFGHALKGKTTVYAKIGLTPSISLSSNHTTQGSYSVKGYYQKWGLLLEDIEELGFLNDQDCNSIEEKPTINKFVLWGNLAVGANVALGELPIQVSAGMKIDYSIMRIGMTEKSNTVPDGQGLLLEGGNVLIPSVNVGLIYLLK